MKIEQIILKKNKLLKLNFLKAKLYKKLYINNINTNEIIIKLKQSLQIIYKYHINNKKILFVGFSPNIINKFKYILKDTDHVLIPKFIWPNGILTNKKTEIDSVNKNQFSTSKQLSDILYKFNKKFDLIVILDSSYEENILNESYNSKIPTIYLSNYLNKFFFEPSYKIIGNINFSGKNFKNNFLYLILHSLFKKAKLFKKENISINEENKKQFYVKTKKFNNKFKNKKYS